LGEISSRTELYFSQYWLVVMPKSSLQNLLNSESLCNARYGTSREWSDNGPLLLQTGEGKGLQATRPRPRVLVLQLSMGVLPVAHIPSTQLSGLTSPFLFLPWPFSFPCFHCCSSFLKAMWNDPRQN
jgi:hypothetical protein